MNDTVVIEKILEYPILKQEIDNMVQRTRAINLVQPDWKNVLQEAPLYQKYKDDKIEFATGYQTSRPEVTIYNIIGMQNCFNVIVAGYWSIEHPQATNRYKNNTNNTNTEVRSNNPKYPLVSRLCTPLIEIGQLMMSSNSKQLLDNCKFYIEECNSFCNKDCRDAKAQAPSTDKNNWCYLKCKIFDGDDIDHFLKSQLLKSFGVSSFLGILHLQITLKYTFAKDSYKIGGICKEMVLFKESALFPITLHRKRITDEDPKKVKKLKSHAVQ